MSPYRLHAPREVPVSAENIVGLIVAIGLLGYLVVALIKPERF